MSLVVDWTEAAVNLLKDEARIVYGLGHYRANFGRILFSDRHGLLVSGIQWAQEPAPFETLFVDGIPYRRRGRAPVPTGLLSNIVGPKALLTAFQEQMTTSLEFGQDLAIEVIDAAGGLFELEYRLVFVRPVFTQIGIAVSADSMGTLSNVGLIAQEIYRE